MVVRFRVCGVDIAGFGVCGLWFMYRFSVFRGGLYCVVVGWVWRRCFFCRFAG